ncbi:MAG TPA: patatin-like phospholipase family protein [Saprospiraceae bacterium]|nr:patatin-like phospholipase family protein [Saprospiraceae bacterium]
MRALVISGGGSKGAFAAGVAKYLIGDLNYQYDIIVGTSTGSLLGPLCATGDMQKVKLAYTTVGQKDIYNISPFIIKRLPDGSIKSRINHFNVIRMFIKGKKTFGEHKNLRKTIERFFTRNDYEAVKQSNIKVVATVANLTLKKIEYKYLQDYSYEDFCDWMWISSSFVPFMSLVEKNGFEYADGGFGNYIPVEEAIAQGATHIDVIVLSPRHRSVRISKTRNAFDIMMQSMYFMLQQIAYDDILIGHLQSIYNENIHIRYFFTPRELTEHSYFFDKNQMAEWWNEGYSHARNKLKNYQQEESKPIPGMLEGR